MRLVGFYAVGCVTAANLLWRNDGGKEEIKYGTQESDAEDWPSLRGRRMLVGDDERVRLRGSTGTKQCATQRL